MGDSADVLVIVAPGQGSQTPGFLAPWLELPVLADRMAWLSTVAGVDLVEHGTRSDAATIRDTAIAQPLIVAAGISAQLELFAHPSDGHALIGAAAGHSVGEIVAATLAGVLSPEQAMVIVRERSRLMAAASAATPTGMSAVNGGDPDLVAAALDRHGLVAANLNGAGQVVAAGRLERLAALAADPPAGSRVEPLEVAGAFHTGYMAPVVDVLAGYARVITTYDAQLRLVSNVDGTMVHSGADVLSRLVTQVAAPVRWDLCMRTLAELGVTGLIELPPAGTLVDLASRALPGVETLALRSPADLPAARSMIERHGLPHRTAVTPSWRVVISPIKGRIRRAELPLGGSVGAGTEVGTVHGRRDAVPVIAAHGGTVVEWLVEEDDPVAPGQPVLRLHPFGSATIDAVEGAA